ncbi:MAG: ABC transporter permease [Alphaproteobacteria bacterium]|nr:ABC transporter permease [Alphaproteobacteria bacterium]
MPEQILSAGRMPLKKALAASQRKDKLTAFLMVAPLLAFILITFLMPIVDMLYRSVDNSIVPETLPRTVVAIEEWNPDTTELPSEAVYAALHADIAAASEQRTHTRVGQRLNYENPGISSLFRSAGRKLKTIKAGPYKEAMIAQDKRWGDTDKWRTIQTFSKSFTWGYFVNAFDGRFNNAGGIELRPENERIYMFLMWRTVVMSLTITLMTLLLGFPIAYLLAIVPTRISNLLIILVLLPFWTSLLVRTTSWIALLQQQGVVNDFLVLLGLLSEDGRLVMMYNSTGTMIAMTHILLPFMVLPLYSVMKTISPSYMRAAISLGAHPWRAFWRIYFPNTIPGIGAGGILVFILATGYYITPALVGGNDGVFISNRIAYNISLSLNWGLAAALSVILLALVMVMFIVYDNIVGINNIKVGS